MKVEEERQLLQQANQKGFLGKIGTYFHLSGPGWLQSAITLGGGSLASSLYLGVLAGVSMMWLQPFAMILGIIMLSAIGYVTLSTGERPFGAINRHVNPVLGWSWALASLAANMVWCLPQYSLATSVLQNNLLPASADPSSTTTKLVIVGIILVVTTLVTWSYNSGSWGIRLYESTLKVMVAAIVLCFIGVVIVLTVNQTNLNWGDVFRGFVPDITMLYKPAAHLQDMITKLPTPELRALWETRIINDQRDVMISAAATAVGINMTFLLPYTLLRRGWSKEFRGLLRFDLATGMLIPFTLATSCVIIAAASQFHAHSSTWEKAYGDAELRKSDVALIDKAKSAKLKEQLGASAFDDLSEEQVTEQVTAITLTREETLQALLSKAQKKDLARARTMQLQATLGSKYSTLSESKRKDELKKVTLSDNEKELALSLERRNSMQLATSLEPLTGNFFANIVFGLGVLGMTLSTITILMLISGLVICEMFNVPTTGWTYRIGTLAATTGVLGPFVWSSYGFYLAIPTSVFGMVLLPIAYLSFFFLMNQKKLLKDELPRGGKRFAANILMAIAAGIATFASLWVVWQKTSYIGIGSVVGLLALALIVHFVRPKPTPLTAESGADSNNTQSTPDGSETGFQAGKPKQPDTSIKEG